MNKLKFFISFIIAFIFLLLTTLSVAAADLNIDCPVSPTTCSKIGLDPLFSSVLDGYWYPGRSLTKIINLKNSSLEKREMAVKGIRTSSVNILDDVMHISIIGGKTIIWSGSVTDFYSQDKIEIGIFNPRVDFDYNFTVSMSSEADNDYQNRQTVFDLTLGFWGEPILISTPTLIPTPTAGAFSGITEVSTSLPVFLSGVLGKAIPLAELKTKIDKVLTTKEGEVAGIETKLRNWWVLILIGLVGIGGGFVLYLRFFHKK